MTDETIMDLYWQRREEAIPPHRPPRLFLFLGKITRELALNRVKARLAQKRGGGEVPLALEELEDYAGFQVNGVNYYFVTE